MSETGNLGKKKKFDQFDYVVVRRGGGSCSDRNRGKLHIFNSVDVEVVLSDIRGSSGRGI